jgi:hypothetical protein
MVSAVVINLKAPVKADFPFSSIVSTNLNFSLSLFQARRLINENYDLRRL